MSMPGQQRGNRWGSIQSRLTILLLAIFIPVLAVQGYLYYDRYQALKKAEFQANLEIARAVSNAFKAFIENILDQELSIGLAITSSQSMLPSDVNRLLKGSRNNPAIRDFTWMNLTGEAIYSSNDAMIGRNYSDRSYFREVVDGREWKVGDLIFAKTTGEETFGISRGIRDNKGALLGIVFAAIVPEKLVHVLAFERSKDAGVSLIDSKGIHVFRWPKTEYTWEQRNWLKHYPIIAQVLAGNEATSIVTSEATGIKRIVGFSPVPATGWLVAASRAEADVFPPVYWAMLPQGILFLTTLLLAVLSALALSRPLVTSISRLRDHALALGLGRMDEIQISGPSEIQDLSEAFNRMTEEVKLREEALRRSELRLRRFYESGLIGVIYWNMDGKITDANGKFLQMVGYTREDLQTGRIDWLQMTPHEHRHLDEASIKELRDNGVNAMPFEKEYIRKDGTRVPVIIAGAMLDDARFDGVAFVLDITAQKETEKALRQQAQFPEENPNPVARVKSDGRLLYANVPARSWLARLGWHDDGPLPEAVRSVVENVHAPEPIALEVPDAQGGTFLLTATRPPGEDYTNLYGVDITNRIAAEKALRESEQRFRLAQQASGIGSFDWNIQTGVNVWTPELEIMYGLQPGEFGKTQPSWEQLIHPEDRPNALRLVDHAFKTGESVEGEWRVVWRDGSMHWITGRWQVLKDKAGTPLRMIGVNMDITARKHAETELARTKTLLETLLLQAPIGFCFFDRELRYVMINDRLAEINGLPVAAHIGQTVADIVPSLLPTAQEVTERILATGKAEVGHEFSGETASQPGVTRYWSESWYPVCDPAGAIIGFGVIIEEITARKQAEAALRQSEERLSLAVHGAGMGTWDVDCRTGRSIWSRTHFEILGYPVNESGESTQEMWRSRIHPEDLSEVTRALETARSTGSLYAPEYRIFRADTGEVRWLSDFGRFLRDDAGETIRYVGIFFDTTERKKAEQELRRLNENLEQAVQERTEKLRRLASELTLVEQRERKKLSTILHDGLQQYLVAAKMQLNGLMPEVAEDRVRRSISDIEQLLGDAVQVSRSLAAELSPPILRDAGILAGLEWLSRWMLEKHRLKVQLNMEMDAPSLEEDVKILLFESVRELLLNTVKHSNSRSAKIHLFQSGDQLGLTVSDDGKGFAPEAPSELCSKAGFGLFSIQERLSVVGGTFKIDSAPGKGCRITLTAPFGQSGQLDSSQTAAEAQPVPSPASAGGSLGRVRIMIVDDHIVMREGLARLLAQEPDFDVIGQAVNGQQAIERVALLRPNLILMDISMPVLDGIEATKIIHKQHPHIHIIGLSLYTEGERAREMISAGASFYMSKSGPPSELKAAIRSCAVN